MNGTGSVELQVPGPVTGSLTILNTESQGENWKSLPVVPEKLAKLERDPWYAAPLTRQAVGGDLCDRAKIL